MVGHRQGIPIANRVFEGPVALLARDNTFGRMSVKRLPMRQNSGHNQHRQNCYLLHNSFSFVTSCVWGLCITTLTKEVRSAAVQALGHHGSEPAILLLRLKARIGDPDPDVVSECLSGLLASSPKDSLPFVAEFLDSPNTALAEAAILALGKSRLPQAFDLLKNALIRRPIGMNEEVYLAMAMLRLPAATDYLLEVVTHENDKASLAALSALLIYRYDPSLRERLAHAVAKNGSHALQAKLERASGNDP